MHWLNTKSRAIALSTVVALVAACGGGAPAAQGNATVRLAAPTDGATVSVPFTVQIEASVPIGEPSTGNHHVHLYFDSSTDSGDYDILYETTAQVTRPLAPGEHTIIVALANPDHSLAGPTQEIHIVVSGQGGGGASPSASPSAPAKGPGYDY